MGSIWFPPGSSIAAVFPAVDETIPGLQGFITEVAEGLRIRQPLAAAVRSAAERFPAAHAAFDLSVPDSAIESSFALKDELTFPSETLPSVLRFSRGTQQLSFRLPVLDADDLGSLLWRCSSGDHTAERVREEMEEPWVGLMDALLDRGMLEERWAPPPAPAFGALPGVTRLQHAGLYYRGRDAGVLVDPHFHSDYEPEGIRRTFLRPDFEGRVDAILISHGHRDHWHLPTLLTFPKDTLIVTPSVPRPTMLCPDFAATLHALGFTRVVSPRWYDPPVRVGDLEIHALPFFGEQPLLSELPRHPDLRNHGNTYVIRHETYTSWCLVDSGNDALGRMAEVAQQVLSRFGSIDLLLSNLEEFPVYTPLYITGGHYWLALTPDQLRRFSTMERDVITLGPRGVAEICHIVGASQFLPYAHWWRDLGLPPDPRELTALREVERELRKFGASTEVVPWRVGDTRSPLSGSHRN